MCGWILGVVGVHSIECEEELYSCQFLAEVAVQGEVLAVEESLDIWCDIIHPFCWVRGDLFGEAAESDHIRARGGDIFCCKWTHVRNWVD